MIKRGKSKCFSQSRKARKEKNKKTLRSLRLCENQKHFLEWTQLY